MSAPGAKQEVPIEEYCRVLGRHFARTVLEECADRNVITRVKASLPELVKIIEAEIRAGLERGK